MSEANERQVGGAHYKKGLLQHWDVVDKYRVPYLEGCSSKYWCRWRDKNGRQDVEKSLHYLDKALENLPGRIFWTITQQVKQDVGSLATQHCLSESQASTLRKIMMPRDEAELRQARDEVRDLLESNVWDDPSATGAEKIVSGRPIKDLSNDELRVEHDYWVKRLNDTTGWGAAVGAYEEFRRDCEAEIRRRVGLPDIPEDAPTSRQEIVECSWIGSVGTVALVQLDGRLCVFNSVDLVIRSVDRVL